jgi:leucyl aminopeptidase (aminopeptidase T)
MVIESLRAIFTTNLGVKRQERVLVFSDRIPDSEILDIEERCRRERLRDIALLAGEIGKAFAKKVLFHEYPSTQSHGAEPPEELWRLAFGERTVDSLKAGGLFSSLLAKRSSAAEIEKAEDIVRKHCRSTVQAVIALSNYSTSHTRFRDLLTRVCGCRYASMPLFDMAMLEGPMNVDWRALARRTLAIAQSVNKAETVEITAPNGTHLVMSKRGRKALSDTGILTKKGSFGNLPAGEVYLAPQEGTANGQLVLEWAQTRELKTPVTLTVRNGLVVKVKGDEPFTRVLDDKLNEREENRNIAELGIGTNDKARRPDNILESEKILGTIHVALGDNSSFGGTVMTPFHQDFVFFKPTVVLIHKDGKRTALLKNGRFADTVK